MKEKVFLYAIAATFAIVLSGCNNSKTVSKENFAKVLSQRIAQAPQRLPNSPIGPTSCAIDLRGMPTEINSIHYGSEQLVKRFEALKSIGILTSKVVKEEDSFFSGKVTTTQYDISEKGKQMAKSSGSYDFSLPYCQVTFQEVKAFKEPAGETKPKTVYVEYTFTVEKVDEWVKHPDILQQFPDVKNIVDSVGQPRNAHM